MKKKLIAMILTGSMLTATFAGCGSTSSGSSNTATSASTTVASSASASSTLTLDEIKKKGQLVVATEAAYEPFEYLDDDGETIIGYNADLFNQICDDLGVKLVYQDLPFQGILAGLDAHKYDVVGATLGITAERAKSYTMTYKWKRSELSCRVSNTSTLSHPKTVSRICATPWFLSS